MTALLLIEGCRVFRTLRGRRRAAGPDACLGGSERPPVRSRDGRRVATDQIADGVAAVLLLGATAGLQSADVLDARALFVRGLDVAIDLRLGVFCRLGLLLGLATSLARLAVGARRGGLAHHLAARLESATRDRAHARLHFRVEGFGRRPVRGIDLAVLLRSEASGFGLKSLPPLFCHLVHTFLHGVYWRPSSRLERVTASRGDEPDLFITRIASFTAGSDIRRKVATWPPEAFLPDTSPPMFLTITCS